MTPASHSSDLRERLIQAAAVAFAQNGFHAVAVRDITSAVGANVAAVNYHFGSKAGLYREVLDHLMAQPGCDRSCAARSGLTREARIGALVQDVFDSLRAHQGSLLSLVLQQEDAAPSGVLGPILGRLIQPRHQALVARLREAAPGPISEDAAHRIAKTLIDAVKGYEMDREGVLQHLCPEVFSGEGATARAIEDMSNQLADMLDGAARRFAKAVA